MSAYIRLEYIEDSGFGVADIVVLLNGLFDMRLHKLIQFIAILICIDACCDFGNQNDQQKAEELKNETKASISNHILLVGVPTLRST